MIFNQTSIKNDIGLGHRLGQGRIGNGHMVLLKKKGNFKVSREEWIAMARKTLIREGISGVKVERLADKLGVSRGGFYWFFKNRNEMMDALLVDWENTNTLPLFDVVEKAGPDGLAQFKAIAELWLAEKDFSPAYDSAIRDWARVSGRARAVVEKVDERRINLLTSICERLGFDAEEAFIRARITYFHQIGYYSLGLRESEDLRHQYLPLYIKILAGSY
jgi:AcrR family transcriptional regulator